MTMATASTGMGLRQGLRSRLRSRNGMRKKNAASKAGNDNDGEHHLRAFPELEPLEHGQVIPLGPGKKCVSAGLAMGPKPTRMEVREKAEAAP